MAHPADGRVAPAAGIHDGRHRAPDLGGRPPGFDRGEPRFGRLEDARIGGAHLVGRMAEGEVPVEIAEVAAPGGAHVDDEEVSRLEPPVGGAHIDLLVAVRAGHRDQVGDGVGAEFDQEAVKNARHLSLGEPRPEAETEAREGLARQSRDLPHPRDLERALDHAHGPEHRPRVDKVAPPRVADPEEIRDRHLDAHLGPDLGGDAAP